MVQVRVLSTTVLVLHHKPEIRVYCRLYLDCRWYKTRYHHTVSRTNSVSSWNSEAGLCRCLTVKNKYRESEWGQEVGTATSLETSPVSHWMVRARVRFGWDQDVVSIPSDIPDVQLPWPHMSSLLTESYCITSVPQAAKPGWWNWLLPCTLCS